MIKIADKPKAPKKPRTAPPSPKMAGRADAALEKVVRAPSFDGPEKDAPRKGGDGSQGQGKAPVPPPAGVPITSGERPTAVDGLIRVTFPMSPALHGRVQEYRFEQRCGSLSEAIRKLLEEALGEEGR